MTISEVSQKYGLSQDTLRYYERIGLIPKVERTKSGIRNYTEESCGWISLVKCMRSAGIPIDTLIEYCALMQQGDDTLPARKELLVGEREKLIMKIEEMQKTLERLNKKIDWLDMTNQQICWEKEKESA
ncbi:MAG TPA: MerR family transcriptional regulator [Lachnospiraceae bacterium]|nr:MerR family transcriptional regulator [Lachnospiraceae bacterium]